ncbi:hypothetical protein DFH06DRAFT_1128609 [Mycena polygramma]|nr:hypothetical protein DFH06DRAFT_1128609 [Mycena polygramma]
MSKVALGEEAVYNQHSSDQTCKLRSNSDLEPVENGRQNTKGGNSARCRHRESTSAVTRSWLLPTATTRARAWPSPSKTTEDNQVQLATAALAEMRGTFHLGGVRNRQGPSPSNSDSPPIIYVFHPDAQRGKTQIIAV